MNLNSNPEIDFVPQYAHLLNRVEQSMHALVIGDTAHRESMDMMGFIGLYHLQTGGRRVRARLALAATAALGHNPEAAVEWAAACELLHNATLIHDDIQDGDQVRRGRRTVWAEFGLPQAINAGDLFLMTGLRGLEKSNLSATTKWALSQCFLRAAEMVVRGQAQEMLLPQLLTSPDLRQRYEDVVRQKTSALFALPVQGAALIAGRNGTMANHVAESIAGLGLVFQICDDLMDVLGRKGRGAPGEDLREGKVSSVIVEYLDSGPHPQALIEFLMRPRPLADAEDVHLWLDEFARLDMAHRVRGWVSRLTQEVKDRLDGLPDEALAEVLAELLEAVVAQVREE